MAPYARYVPPKSTALAAADTTTASHVSVPSQPKQVKVPKGPSRSDDDHGRKKRKRAEIDNPPTTAVTDNDHEAFAIPSKHSAVYSKFQKAAQRSEAARAAAPDDNDALTEQPELHGMRRSSHVHLLRTRSLTLVSRSNTAAPTRACRDSRLCAILLVATAMACPSHRRLAIHHMSF